MYTTSNRHGEITINGHNVSPLLKDLLERVQREKLPVKVATEVFVILTRSIEMEAKVIEHPLNFTDYV